MSDETPKPPSRVAQIQPYQWKPGVSPNPGGKAKIPTDIAEARKISQFEFERIVNKYLFMNNEEFSADVTRPAATQFERLIGGIISKAISTKDEKKAEWILARTLGKMRDKLDIRSESVRLNIQATPTMLPTLEQLALENPDLSRAQLESFSDKLAKMREELQATKEFKADVLDTIDVSDISPESLAKHVAKHE